MFLHMHREDGSAELICNCVRNLRPMKLGRGVGQVVIFVGAYELVTSFYCGGCCLVVSLLEM